MIDLGTALLMYFATSLLWTAYAVRMQHRLYGKDTNLLQYGMVSALNLLLWPICLTLCIFVCPVSAAKGGPKNEG